jgi:hypothetical protein
MDRGLSSAVYGQLQETETGFGWERGFIGDGGDSECGLIPLESL